MRNVPACQVIWNEKILSVFVPALIKAEYQLNDTETLPLQKYLQRQRSSVIHGMMLYVSRNKNSVFVYPLEYRFPIGILDP